MKWATRFVDRQRGENDSNPESNGEFALLGCLAPGLKRVVDGGANRGEWAGWLWKRNRGLELACVEPHPTLASAAEKRLQGTGARVFRAALGAEDGEAELHVYADEYSEGHSLYRRESIGVSYGVAAQTRSVRVPVWKVDRVLAEAGWETACYLKLDVEGHEPEVLRGAEAALKEGRVGAGQFEYGGTYIDARVLLKDAFAVLTATGCEVFLVMPWGLRRVGAYDSRLENFQFKTFAFFRRGNPLLERCRVEG
ncbi:MAG: FkbM family methyltransferase [Verrucomicrobiia bacterium]